ncbi:hypothetical protein [Streptomyces griseochromogenes]|uniref:hypothetical protein n=1 Tax=Streptomyces griseochromogenes TaxID=68214 RepID=UPI00379D2469
MPDIRTESAPPVRTGPGRSRRVRPAAVLAVVGLALLVLTFAVSLPAAWRRVEVRGATPADATLHGGACFFGGCSVTFSVAGERVTADLPVGTRTRGHGDGDTVAVRSAAGEPERVALADDTGPGSVAALLAVPGAATLLALLAGALHIRRDERREDPAGAV